MAAITMFLTLSLMAAVACTRAAFGWMIRTVRRTTTIAFHKAIGHKRALLLPSARAIKCRRLRCGRRPDRESSSAPPTQHLHWAVILRGSSGTPGKRRLLCF
jgi:hypothetical protein